MRKRFTRAFYAATAAATLAIGLGVAGAGTASASTQARAGTPQCAASQDPSLLLFCFNLFSDVLGSGTTANAYVPGDTGSIADGRVGQKVNMHFASNTRPNGDFMTDIVARVYQLCGGSANDFFSPTSYVCLHYPGFWVIEADWSPYGNESGLCAGVDTTMAPYDGENVTLQPCGVSANTVWIADRVLGYGGDCRTPSTIPVAPGGPANFCPWINGGDTKFSHPLVLTLDAGTQRPVNQLRIENVNLVGGVARNDQQFAFYLGATP